MGINRVVLYSILCLTGCQAEIVPSQVATNTKSPLLAYTNPDQLITPQNLQLFLIQKLKSNHPSLKLPKVDWRQQNSFSDATRHPDLLITDVLLDTGESVMKESSTANISPDFTGKEIHLTLKGSFENKRELALRLKPFLFTLEPPLIQQSFLPRAVPSAVLLDDAILCPVTAVSATEMKVSLDSSGLIDLYLAGKHKLTLLHGKYYTDTLVRVANPALPPNGALTTRISSVEIIRNDRQEPRFIKLTGTGFPVQTKFSYATVDHTFGFGYQTNIFKENDNFRYETLIHVPDPIAFDQHQGLHTLVYATPFSTAFTSF